MPQFAFPIRWYEWIASTLIGTPLQRPADGLRWVAELPKRFRHPELHEIFVESKRTARLIEKAVTDNTNCIDIGGHLGSVLCQFVRRSPNGRHIAIEPIPYKANWLKLKFPQVEVHQVAVGEEEKEAEFFYNPRRSGFSALLPQSGTGELKIIKVGCKRLDEIVPLDMPVGFLKVDVEGGELGVLKGARRVISESQPIILFECTRTGLSTFGLTAKDVFSFFEDDILYRIFLIKDWLLGGRPLDLPRFEASMVYPFQAFNYVAASRSHGFR
jgi:FkbM family methyltransferase